MKKKLSILDYIFIASLIVHLLLGVLVIVLSNEVFEKDHIFIGAVLAVSGVPSLLIFFAASGHKNFRKFPYLTSAIIAFVVGIIFIIFDELTLDHMLLTVGIFDIIRGLYETIDASLEIKENKLEILEIISSVGDIVFGILLCIKLSDGYKNHLIFMGVALIIVGIKFLFDLIIDLKKKN